MYNILKHLREENNFTQEFMAREIDISLTQYRNIEYGNNIPSVETAIKIKRILKIIDIEEIFIIE